MVIYQEATDSFIFPRNTKISYLKLNCSNNQGISSNTLLPASNRIQHNPLPEIKILARQHSPFLMYEGCPDGIQPFWIFREPVAWDLDVICQPVRGHLTVHPRTVTRPWGQSVGSETPLTELVYSVTVAFTMTETADQLHHDNAPAHSTALVQVYLAKHHITPVCQPSYSQDLAPCDFWLFPKLKSPLKERRFLNATVAHYTLSVNGVSLPTD